MYQAQLFYMLLQYVTYKKDIIMEIKWNSFIAQYVLFLIGGKKMRRYMVEDVRSGYDTVGIFL